MSESKYEFNYDHHKNSHRVYQPKYKYYDSPEGQDLVKKLYYTTLIGAKVGYLYGIHESILGVPGATGILHTVVKSTWHAIPWMVAPATFTLVVYAATNVREKDDYYNYMLGGITSGLVTGAVRRSWEGASWFSVLFCAAALVARKLREDGVPWHGKFEPLNFQVQTVRSLKGLNFSIVDERPKNWYSAEEVKEKGLVLPKGTPTFLN